MTRKKRESREVRLPSVEEIQNELAQVESIDDFFGKEGVFGKLFARTIEEMLEAELSAHLGYEKYEASGRNSGNSRNGKRERECQMACVNGTTSRKTAPSVSVSGALPLASNPKGLTLTAADNVPNWKERRCCQVASSVRSSVAGRKRAHCRPLSRFAGRA